MMTDLENPNEVVVRVNWECLVGESVPRVCNNHLRKSFSSIPGNIRDTELEWTVEAADQPAGLQLGLSQKQKLGCEKGLGNPWRTIFDWPQSRFGKPSDISRKGSSAQHRQGHLKM